MAERLQTGRMRGDGVAAGASALLLLALLAACSRQTTADAPAPAAALPAAAPAAAAGAPTRGPAGTATGVSTGTATVTPAGDSVYDHAFDDADGRRQSLSQWKGKFLVLNFWATWCAPCVAEMPDLEKAQQVFAARNVVIVGLGTEAPARVREFRDQHRMHLNLLAGGYDALGLARSLGNTQGVLPYTVLVSPDGRVLQTQTGPLQPGQLSRWLDAAR